jgi:hypothetical protein
MIIAENETLYCFTRLDLSQLENASASWWIWLPVLIRLWQRGNEGALDIIFEVRSPVGNFRI